MTTMTDQPRAWSECSLCYGRGVVAGTGLGITCAVCADWRNKLDRPSGMFADHLVDECPERRIYPCPVCARHFLAVDEAVKSALLDKWPLCKHYDCLRVDEAVKAEREACASIELKRLETVLNLERLYEVGFEEAINEYRNAIRARAKTENGRTR